MVVPKYTQIRFCSLIASQIHLVYLPAYLVEYEYLNINYFKKGRGYGRIRLFGKVCLRTGRCIQQSTVVRDQLDGSSTQSDSCRTIVHITLFISQ